MGSITQLAHERVATVVRPGDLVIDATAGNGHDAAFLAELVGPHGRVLAIDRQQVAVEKTRQRLRVSGTVHADVVLGDHAEIDVLARRWMGELGQEATGRNACATKDVDATCRDVFATGGVAAVMFNLGYLPGGEKSIITEIRSTLPALAAAASLLRTGGILSVVAYPGHPGGDLECRGVEEWFQQLSDTDWCVEPGDLPGEASASPARSGTGPRLFTAVRLRKQ